MSKDSVSPYKPSWINRFNNWIGRRSGPSWVYYAGFGLILLVIQTTVSWFENAIPFGTFQPIHIFLSAATAFIAGIISYFDARALTSLESIKPSLSIGEIEYQQFAYQLTNLPAFKTIFASVLALIFLFTTEWIGDEAYYIDVVTGYTLSSYLSRAVYLICWWFFGVFIYHTIHQLGLINQVYTFHTLIDLFQMKPIYGFSNLTALTAGSLVMLPYGFLYVNTEVQLTNPIVLSTYVIISIIALSTFLLPQLGIHRLQQEEKERLLAENNQRYKAAMGEVHKRVDGKKYDSAAALVEVLNVLTNERKTISGISTWPWQPETLRWLFTATVLPLIIWIAQLFIGQWLNP